MKNRPRRGQISIVKKDKKNDLREVELFIIAKKRAENSAL